MKVLESQDHVFAIAVKHRDLHDIVCLLVIQYKQLAIYTAIVN